MKLKFLLIVLIFNIITVHASQKIRLFDFLPYAVAESETTFVNPTDEALKKYLGFGWGSIVSSK